LGLFLRKSGYPEPENAEEHAALVFFCRVIEK
jgi:hypothetical protein